MGVNNLDQRAPALDVWVSLPVHGRGARLILPSGDTPIDIGDSLDGYSISCIPTVTGIVPPDIARGRNLYAQLAAGIRVAARAAGVGASTNCAVYVILDDRDRYQIALRVWGYASAPAFFRVRLPEVVDAIPARWASARWLGFETTDGDPMDISFTAQTVEGLAGLWAVTEYGPVGLWQPEHMGWTTLAERAPNYRVTASPYDGRVESRLMWGVRDSTELRWEMVHAAQIWRDRNADIPCEGWASAAHLARLRGVTLERLLPWMAHARPQDLGPTGDVSLWANDGINNLSSDPSVHAYDPAWGCPMIAYFDPAAVRAPGLHVGYQMKAFWGTAAAGAYPMVSDNVSLRHYTLQDGATLRSLVEEQLGARRLRVSLPLYDVTHPATYLYTQIGDANVAIEGPTMGGDY